MEVFLCGLFITIIKNPKVIYCVGKGPHFYIGCQILNYTLFFNPHNNLLKLDAGLVLQNGKSEVERFEYLTKPQNPGLQSRLDPGCLLGMLLCGKKKGQTRDWDI